MRTKTIIYSLIPVALIAGATAYHLSQRNAELGHQAKVKSEGLLAVTLVPVEERAFRPAVAFTGTLLAVNRAELKGEVTGRMTRVAVQEGDTRRRRGPARRPGRRRLPAGVQAAEAQLAQAKAQALQAQRDNDRAISLLEKRSITRQSAQQAETAYNATRAAVQAAESNLGMARLRLKKARIVAPFAGQVARRLVQPGRDAEPRPVRLRGGGQSQAGDPGQPVRRGHGPREARPGGHLPYGRHRPDRARAPSPR